MEKVTGTKKYVGVIAACVTAVAAMLCAKDTAFATEKKPENRCEDIVVDGQIDDWMSMGTTAASELRQMEWKFARSEDGCTLYFYCQGPTVTEWDGSYDYKYVEFDFGGTKSGMYLCDMKDKWVCGGAEVERKNTAHGNNKGVCIFEGSLPIRDHHKDFYIHFEGKKHHCSDLPVFVPTDKEEVVYKGIVIDGRFYDWRAVEKTATGEKEDALNGIDCLSEVACVFDGDYVYIYIRDGEVGNAAGAGTHSNGRYSITTDTGRTLTFEINGGCRPSISGVDGAQVKYFGDQWEISIPASELPLYKESIAFGLYMQEPFVSNIVNLQGGEGTAGDFTGIVYDGMFGDWSAYPHTLIQYATAGTQTDDPDGEGALYNDGSILYGHVVSSMDAHLAEDGGEFASAVSIFFNGDHEYNGDKTNNLYPFFIAVAEDGTINWNPQTAGLDNGLYEFYIMDARMEIDRNYVKNISQLKDHEQPFGRIYVDISDTCDEMEFFIDLEQVAKYLSYYSGNNIEASDFKLIEAQFGKIGQEIISSAGTSSGPLMGVALCIAVVSGTLLVKRRRNKAVA